MLPVLEIEAGSVNELPTLQDADNGVFSGRFLLQNSIAAYHVNNVYTGKRRESVVLIHSQGASDEPEKPTRTVGTRACDGKFSR